MSVCLPQRCLCCHFFKCLSLRVTWGPGKHNTHFNYCRALDWILGVCAILSSLVWKNAFPAVLGVLTLNYVIPLCLRGRQKEMCITVLFVVIRCVCDGCKWGNLVGVLGWRNASMFQACLEVSSFHGDHALVVSHYLPQWEVWGLAGQPRPYSFGLFNVFKWTSSRDNFLASFSQTPTAASSPRLQAAVKWAIMWYKSYKNKFNCNAMCLWNY